MASIFRLGRSSLLLGGLSEPLGATWLTPFTEAFREVAGFCCDSFFRLFSFRFASLLLTLTLRCQVGLHKKKEFL